MDVVTVSIGAIIVAYGLYTIFVRVKAPEVLSKLQPMRDAYGEKMGTAVHAIAYSVLPIILGGLAIFAGLRGVSFLDFIG